jgi:hypothetical protein
VKRTRHTNRPKSKKKDWKKVISSFFTEPGQAAGIIRSLKRYAAAVKAGSDPIEAAHGHICGNGCWHDRFKTAVGQNPPRA